MTFWPCCTAFPALRLASAVQLAAQFGQGAAAACHLFGVLADGAHEVHQISPQAVERRFDILQFTVAGAHMDVAAEISLCPGRQGRSEAGQRPGQAPLQGIDEQCDQQDQANHQALDHAYFALDPSVLGAHRRLHGVDCLLHIGGFQMRGIAQFRAFLNQFAGAGQFRRVAA
jgi:hypothetical protein